MKGWLVVNSFLNSSKFDEIYNMLKDSAEEAKISLEIKKTSSLFDVVDTPRQALPDFVLFWDKDIYHAQMLEKLGVPVFNSAKAVELCDNKILMALALQGKVNIPKTIIAPKTFEGLNYNNLEFLEHAIEVLHLPLIIKEAYGSFGQQVYLAGTKEEAYKIIERLGSKEFLMQEFISSSYGKDLRIYVVGGKVVSTMLRYNENDFRSNITNGGKMQLYKPTPQQKAIAIKASKVLGLDFAGVDVMFGKDGEPVLCEVNSNPHFKSNFDCTGIDVSKFIIQYVLNKLSKKKL